MLKYNYLNVNPKGYRTGDCSTRAIVSTVDISYEEALRLQYEEAVKGCYGITNKQTVERVLKHFHWMKMKQPIKLDGKKYKVKELDQILTRKQLDKGVLVTISGHHTCVKGNKILDTWDCSDYAVRNYYVKEF